MVPLQGENRTLVRKGLTRLNRMERPGVEALCRHSHLKSGQIDATAIGYALGPRLNAAGRLEHAKTAYQLLETRYRAEAERLAEVLDQLNRKRRKLTMEIQEEARRLALATADGAPLLFAAAPNFHLGIVGLVASRLVDEFYRPAVVVEMGETVSRGSARSVPEFHITRALDQCTGLLIRYGGHAAAGGFTVANENLDRLEAELRRLVTEQLADVELISTLNVDVETELSQMSRELQQELTQLEPYGYANPQPLFLSRNVRVRNQRTVGTNGKHLKLALSDGQITWDAIAFRQGEWGGKLPDYVDIVYHLEINDWRDRRWLQLNVQDIRPSGLDDFTSASFVD
jgi:single-stranded-DNA-specific exonuclease